MREKFAEIAPKAWERALDTGEAKVERDFRIDKPSLDERMARVDAMIERQNERFAERERQRVLGEKALKVAERAREKRLQAEAEERARRRHDQNEETMAIIDQTDRANGPAQAMQTFREMAQREHENPQELWKEVNDQAKAERYEADKDIRKFYFGMTMAQAEKFLQAGKITRETNDGNPLNSEIALTADYKDEKGVWHPVVAVDDDGNAPEVVFVLDGALVDEDGFTAVGRQPRAEEIDLKKSCLAVMTTKERTPGMRKLVRENKNGVNFMTAGDIRRSSRELRDAREWVRKDVEFRNKFTAEVYTKVSEEGVAEAVDLYLRRAEQSSVGEIAQFGYELKSEAEKRAAEKEIVKFYGDILGIQNLPVVQHRTNLKGQEGADYRHSPDNNPDVITLYENKVNTMILENLVELIGHEMWHAHQHNVVDRLDGRQLDGDIKKRAKLYKINFANAIQPDEDIDGYKKQLVEAEAYRFSANLLPMMMEKIDEAKRPVNRLKHGIRRLTGR